jgi:hypothetical protein
MGGGHVMQVHTAGSISFVSTCLLTQFAAHIHQLLDTCLVDQRPVAAFGTSFPALAFADKSQNQCLHTS